MQINELFDGRDHALSDKGVRTYTRVFHVITDDPYVGPAAVRAALGISRGDPYITDSESDLQARVRRIQPQQQDNPRLWEVRVEYDSTQEEESESPFDKPPEVSWDFAQFTRVAYKDRDGKAILNSAGQYFDPPIEIDDSRPVLTVVRNEPSYNPSLAYQYRDAVNSDAFYGAPPGTAKVVKITGASAVENDIPFWRVTYEFSFNPDGWQPSILDQGRYAKIGGKLVPIPEFDTDGNEIRGSHVADPVPLNGNGARLADPNPDNAVFLDFNVFNERAFNALL